MNEQVRMHDGISHVRWAGALMEVRSLFGLSSAFQKNARRTDGRTDPLIESRVRD